MIPHRIITPEFEQLIEQNTYTIVHSLNELKGDDRFTPRERIDAFYRVYEQHNNIMEFIEGCISELSLIPDLE